MKILRWVLQILIGGIIFGSALGKSLDLPGFADVLKTYQAFPESTLYSIAISVTAFEFVLGAWILSGWHLTTSAMTAAVMNLVYAGWMTVTLFRGLNLDNCGCFGVFFPRPLNWFSPIEDLVMVALCVLLAYVARSASIQVSLTQIPK
ncbi:MauE/DoxX family redox-associated membrane protein [Nitrospira sp. M1]